MPNAEILGDFLTRMNMAMTTLLVANSRHMLFFAILAAAMLILLANYVFRAKLRYSHWRIALAFGASLLFVGMFFSISPHRIYQFYARGASSINLIVPESGLDPFSTRIVHDLYTIVQRYTVYDGNTQTLSGSGKRAYEQKELEYLMILRDAQAVRLSFPCYYAAICFSLLFLMLHNIIYPKHGGLLYGAMAFLFASGMILYAYPVKYTVCGYACNGAGLVISTLIAILALRDAAGLNASAK